MKVVLLAPGGSYWLLLALGGSYWLLLALGGSYWLLVAPGGSYWLLVAPGGSWWLLVAPTDYCWLLVAPTDSCWLLVLILTTLFDHFWEGWSNSLWDETIYRISGKWGQSELVYIVTLWMMVPWLIVVQNNAGDKQALNWTGSGSINAQNKHLLEPGITLGTSAYLNQEWFN